MIPDDLRQNIVCFLALSVFCKVFAGCSVVRMKSSAFNSILAVCAATFLFGFAADGQELEISAGRRLAGYLPDYPVLRMESRRFHPAHGPDDIYFNGLDTLRRKTQFARQSGLAGVMVWEIGQDAREPNSLIQVIHASMMSPIT